VQSRREPFRRRLYVAFGAVCRSRTRIRLRSFAPSDLAGRANRDEGRIAPRSTARNTQHQWLTESHIRLAVGSLPTGQAAAVHYYTPKPEPLETVLHKTTEFPPGLRHQVQPRLPAWEDGLERAVR
jgi:hypothetical protein